ncbi:hypothetical protein [Phenylobacterium sp.]|jgi:hypothetical protein|uniref:hypothetical protein n=1 Tax=Phenylobacterium sp. TaxID=1871053 RepID=UPI00391ACEBC
MSKADDPAQLATTLGEALLVTAVGGVMTSGLIPMLASADAFAARVLTSANQASELYALRNLAMIAAQDKPRPKPATRDVDTDRTIVNASFAAGAPVVT